MRKSLFCQIIKDFYLLSASRLAVRKTPEHHVGLQTYACLQFVQVETTWLVIVSCNTLFHGAGTFVVPRGMHTGALSSGEEAVGEAFDIQGLTEGIGHRAGSATNYFC